MAAQSPAAHMAGVGGGGCAIGGGLVTLAKIVILTTVARFSYNEWNSSGCSLEVRLLIISSSKHVDIRYIYRKLSLTQQITNSTRDLCPCHRKALGADLAVLLVGVRVDGHLEGGDRGGDARGRRRGVGVAAVAPLVWGGSGVRTLATGDY